jgi:isoleucyl-tRNA synthetase
MLESHIFSIDQVMSSDHGICHSHKSHGARAVVAGAVLRHTLPLAGTGAQRPTTICPARRASIRQRYDDCRTGELELKFTSNFAGQPHMGHALNKILKDFVVRHQLLKGRRVSYIPGWDCHGLPIELKALEARGKQRSNSSPASPLEVRAIATQFAKEAIDVQARAFRRWGVLGDWEHPYLTMNPEYEASQLAVFYTMYKQGLIYRRRKPVYWSPSSQTALAEAELEYQDHTSKSVFVKFICRPSAEFVRKYHTSSDTVAAIIWTTTPWTLPANRAVAYNPKLSYTVLTHEPTGQHIITGAAFDTGVIAMLMIAFRNRSSG